LCDYWPTNGQTPFFSLQMEAEEPAHVVQARSLLAAMSPEFTSYNQQKTLVRWPDDPKGARCQAVCTTFLDPRTFEWVVSHQTNPTGLTVNIIHLSLLSCLTYPARGHPA
jgi:hypothetical protein